MDLSVKHAKLGMVVSWIVIVGSLVMMPLWFTGLIEEGGDGYYWLLPALMPIAMAMFALTSFKLVSEDEATPGLRYIAAIAAIAFVVDAINMLNSGGISETNSGSCIIIGLFALSLSVNFKNIVPLWARISGVVWGVVFFIDGFVHILFGGFSSPAGVGHGFIGDVQVAETYDQTFFVVGLIGMLVFLFAAQRAFKKIASNG